MEGAPGSRCCVCFLDSATATHFCLTCALDRTMTSRIKERLGADAALALPGVFMCRTCSATAHRVARSHAVKSAAEGDAIAARVRDIVVPSDDAVHAMRAVDEGNKLCAVQERHPHRLVLASAFTTLKPVDAASRQQQLGVVSFVGSSGTGKSSLLRFFTAGNAASARPVPGRIGAVVSTSADIHAYVYAPGPAGASGAAVATTTPPATSGASGAPAQPTIVLLDSEGLNGGAVLAGEFDDDVQAAAYNARRLEYVHHAYPRLLYLFSDVLVLVFNNTTPFKAAVEALVAFGSEAAATVDPALMARTKPHLVVVFNKMPRSDLLDSATATAQFVAGMKAANVDWRAFYADVAVTTLPDFVQAGDEFVTRQDALHALLLDKVAASAQYHAEAGHALTREAKWHFVGACVDALSRDPLARVNLAVLTQVGSVAPNAAAGLLEYARAVIKLRRAQGMAPPDAYDDAVRRVRQRLLPVMLTSMRRSGKGLGPSRAVPPDLAAALVQLSRDLWDLRPCDAPAHDCSRMGVSVNPRLAAERCVLTVGTHGGSHASGSSYVSSVQTRLFGFLGRTETLRECTWGAGGIVLRGAHADDGNRPDLVAALRAALAADPGLSWAPGARSGSADDCAVRDIAHKKTLGALAELGGGGGGVTMPGVCLACLLEPPSPMTVAGCQHATCTSCYRDAVSVGACPVCGKESAGVHDAALAIPAGAAVRALALDDTGGVPGALLQLTLLCRLEGDVGVPTRDMFDVVVGAGMSGAAALLLHRQPTAARTLAQLGELVDKGLPQPYRWRWVADAFNGGNRYPSGTWVDALERVLGDVPVADSKLPPFPLCVAVARVADSPSLGGGSRGDGVPLRVRTVFEQNREDATQPKLASVVGGMRLAEAIAVTSATPTLLAPVALTGAHATGWHAAGSGSGRSPEYVPASVAAAEARLLVAGSGDAATGNGSGANVLVLLGGGVGAEPDAATLTELAAACAPAAAVLPLYTTAAPVGSAAPTLGPPADNSQVDAAAAALTASPAWGSVVVTLQGALFYVDVAHGDGPRNTVTATVRSRCQLGDGALRKLAGAQVSVAIESDAGVLASDPTAFTFAFSETAGASVVAAQPGRPAVPPPAWAQQPGAMSHVALPTALTITHDAPGSLFVVARLRGPGDPSAAVTVAPCGRAVLLPAFGVAK